MTETAEDFIVVSAAELAARTGTTVEEWGLAGDWEVVVFPDGTVNATTDRSETLWSLTAGNPEAAAEVVRAFWPEGHEAGRL